MVGSGLDPKVGQIVPDYELLRRIGGGAYGEVWLARSKATGLLRAAKIVWRHTFDDERPFQREFEGVQRFERISRAHPSQLSLFHIGRSESGDCFYYVMELADNCADRDDYVPHTLRFDLAKGRLPAAQALEMAEALAESLSHLHRHGLVHRDVKPSNVIFVNGRPKLADVGLLTDASDSLSVVGTEGYLAPEGPGSPQADLFALGKVLYEAAMGMDRRLFPELPKELGSFPDADAVLELNEIILRCCAREPLQRFKQCSDVLEELRLIQKGRSVRRKRILQRQVRIAKKLAWGVGVAAALAALAIWLPSKSQRLGPFRDGQGSTIPAANGLCDKAMYILRGDDYVQLLTAYSNFNAAIALDSNFARPYVGLMELRSREDVNVPGLPEETKGEYRNIAAQLERLAPDLAARHCAEAIVAGGNWDFAKALDELSAATRADPEYEFGHTLRASFLHCLGWPEEARKEVEISLQIAPSKTIVYRYMGQVEFVERHFTNAIHWFQVATNLEPHHWAPYGYMGQAYEALGDYTNGLNCYEKRDLLLGEDETKTRMAYAAVLHTLAVGGVRGYWEDQWQGTLRNPNRDFYHKAIIRIHLGDTNGALDWLEKDYQNRANWGTEPEAQHLLFDEYWDRLHDNRRFRKLLDELGYTKVMPARKL